MRGTLGVGVFDGRFDRMVTSKTRGLQFRKTAPGGHHSASCQLLLPRSAFPNLGPADKLVITDSRTGAKVWEGYTENPGAVDGPSGQGFDLSAVGGMVLASDHAETLPYIDSTLDQWRQDDSLPQAASATGGVGQFPDDAGVRSGFPGLFNQFPPGQPITTNKQVGAIYSAFKESTMKLGAFAGFYDAGQTDADYSLQWLTWPNPGGLSSVFFHTASMSATGASFAAYADTDFNLTGANTVTSLVFRLLRASGGATSVLTDNVWAAFGDIVVAGQLVDRFGADRAMSTAAHILVGAPTRGWVLASDVVEDLLGRVLTLCDPTTAVIDTSAAEIDQLAYYDAVTASQVFEDLELHEPDFLWEILETLPNGLHRFNYRAWPTSPRYEISTRDGYNAPGGEIDLCNRIAVAWTDAKGVQKTTVVTSTVPELGARVKDAESVTLPEGRGSAANALRIGTEILAAKNHPPRAATAVVRRPIVDHVRGMYVMPWEIEPGYLVRVRETGEDLRLTEMEYTDDDCAASLTLGTPVLTQDQILARVAA